MVARSDWTFSHTFDVAGHYDYQCNPHANMGMVGTVTVGLGGCMDADACNFDSDADFDDGSCLSNDCAGMCGGSATEDSCGVCEGDGCSCASSCDSDVCLTLSDDNLNYTSSVDIYGFQFNHDGCASGASGGDADANGFTVSSQGVLQEFR